jgi:UPF0271 protein
MLRSIDLNCDVGEGIGNEASLFPYISSCNIATGGHAGDAATMKEVASLAARHRVRVGAHPSYPDRENFGRKSLKLEKGEFQQSIALQLDALGQVLASLKMPMHHIKAHGALYNDLAGGGALALDYLEVLASRRAELKLFAPCGSAFSELAASKGFTIWEEAFADRAYRPDGGLVSRKEPGSVYTDPEQVARQVLGMISQGRVRCSDGSYYAMAPRTICLHGDTPKAAELLDHLTASLNEAQIQVVK